MKCIVLAAGYATRLYPLTENYPKPLLKVLDKPILDWLVDDINSSDIVDEYIIVSNHKYVDFFIDWKSNKKISNKITIIDDGTTDNEHRLGAVSDINLAIEKLNIDDDLMVIAGDNVLDFSLNNFIRYFENKKTSCVMTYYEESLEKLKKCSTLVLDNNDKVLEMLEKPQNPTSNYCCPPFYIFVKEDVKKVKEAINSGCNVDAPGSFINYLYSKNTIHAYKMPGKRYDVGNIESYNHVNEIYKGIIK